ncbi:hypothetical protein SDC9_78477 [bioreactor metagenome]|uniref:Uncharacterized protein n=1 Tax=bioreactor metagenome TaxID=1076179 RepID=A0A644YTL2_9ZZZZ
MIFHRSAESRKNFITYGRCQQSRNVIWRINSILVSSQCTIRIAVLLCLVFNVQTCHKLIFQSHVPLAKLHVSTDNRSQPPSGLIQIKFQTIQCLIGNIVFILILYICSKIAGISTREVVHTTTTKHRQPIIYFIRNTKLRCINKLTTFHSGSNCI